jgi:hypothetical protein
LSKELSANASGYNFLIDATTACVKGEAFKAAEAGVMVELLILRIDELLKLCSL